MGNFLVRTSVLLYSTCLCISKYLETKNIKFVSLVRQEAFKNIHHFRIRPQNPRNIVDSQMQNLKLKQYTKNFPKNSQIITSQQLQVNNKKTHKNISIKSSQLHNNLWHFLYGTTQKRSLVG